MSAPDETPELVDGAAASMGLQVQAGRFGKALIYAAERRAEIVALSADLKKYTDLSAFAEHFPDRYFEIGMAEQNLVMVAAGLANAGLVPVATSFAAFMTRRAHDFTVMQVALPRLNVKLVGAVPGLLCSFGPSHASHDDIAIMRATPNMVVIDPTCAAETGEAIAAALDHDGPVYMRQPFDRGEDDAIAGRAPFRIGKAVRLREGGDVGIIATGAMVHRAIAAAQLLAAEGIHATLLSMPTIKPFDAEAVAELAERTGAIVTVENHSVTGGLFSATAEALAERGIPAVVKPIGIRDTFPPFGEFDYLVRILGMDTKDIAEAARAALRQAKRRA